MSKYLEFRNISQYFCPICRCFHFVDSKIGKKHLANFLDKLNKDKEIK